MNAPGLGSLLQGISNQTLNGPAIQPRNTYAPHVLPSSETARNGNAEGRNAVSPGGSEDGAVIGSFEAAADLLGCKADETEKAAKPNGHAAGPHSPSQTGDAATNAPSNVESGVTLQRLRLQRAGYEPIPLIGKRPPLNGWQNKTNVTQEEIRSWGAQYSLCLAAVR